ncbi:unnamed protein product [Rhizoctonia solani]|uniref:Uncharacterized protein n=1 Tax=Rhizoctonia solani TaxID=456999 RepID=A0A8H3ASR7_9AGAM|nr:unnamed protein product [Rhizoctonia solani]
MTERYPRTPSIPELMVVEYEGRRALISRHPDYQEMIKSIKGAFPRLRTVAESRNRDIFISALLEEVGDMARITPHTWATVLPSLTCVQVDIDASPWVHITVISWTVDAKPDGTLLDRATGREVAYLFWEAYTNPKPPLSPPTTRPGTPTETPNITFNPANPTLLPSESALLPFDKVTGYIDDVLLALGLHTEARTSFITYWLPNLSKHAFIALRFLLQDEYEKAAPLNITPAPDVITRVFMLFGGIEEGQIGQWDEAVTMASREVTVWKDIVGIDVTKVQDKSLFRVLEWGGMEVK